MKRNMDLIRDILLYVEDCENGNPNLRFSTLPEQFSKFDRFVLLEHGLLLIKRNLMEAIDTDDGFLHMRLTWDGHEFLGNAREQEVWNAAKKVAGQASFAVFVGILTKLATHYAVDSLKSWLKATLATLGGS